MNGLNKWLRGACVTTLCVFMVAWVSSCRKQDQATTSADADVEGKQMVDLAKELRQRRPQAGTLPSQGTDDLRGELGTELFGS